MTAVRRICVVTGSRSEYGILFWVLDELRAQPDIELQLVVTGMHLSPEHGHTVDEIARDGFEVSRRVEMLLSSDSPGGIAKSIGLGVIGMSDALSQLAPDVVLVLGDRFEILAAAQACLIHNIPLAHIAGGDTTEGAFDESIRHCITKMAHVHFVTNEKSAERVRQLGENPGDIHVVGSPALDHLTRRPLMDRAALEASLGAPLGHRNLLVTFHPVTLEDSSERQFGELLAALDELPEDVMLWFTRPNADTGARALSAAIDTFVASRPGRSRVYASLGYERYLSLLSHADAVVGNSSSGLYEAPSLHIPTVDIGDRQRGRLAAASVLHVEPDRAAIRVAIDQAFALDCSTVTNPYGDGASAPRIVSVLRGLRPRHELIKKTFHVAEGARG